MPENRSWRTRQLLTCRCVMHVAALDAKYMKELADAKAENDARVMMLPLVVVGCTSKQSVIRCVKPPLPPAWIMQPPPDWQHAERDYFTLRRELITMQKQLEGTQKYINEQCIELPISMGNSCNYCEQYTHSFQRSINA